jgi:HK97 gp10 family phage protein
MATFEINTNAGPLGASLRRFPVLIERYLTPELDKSSKLIAKHAKRKVRENGSMAHSTLIDSIQSSVAGNGLEAIIYAGVNYARYIEEGTRGGGYPNQQTIIDWLRVKHIEPNNPETSEKELAFLIARKIALHGTPAHPFMEPAFQAEKNATLNRVNASINRAMREIH